MMEASMTLRPSALACVFMFLSATLTHGAGPVPDSLDRRPSRIHENTVVDTLPTIEVTDTFDRAVRRVRSSSQHGVTAAEIEQRPVSRPGEILEAVPGVLISQHSGEGKANQYYLRGFNLDHGTDFATFVAGIPVNLPTNAHGQGYADLNFVIPELVSGVEYRKGTYFAEEGDFGTAGAAHIAYANRLDAPTAQLSFDAEGYRRGLVVGSSPLARGDLLYAVEVFHNDGPWVHPDDYRKVNGVVRWGRTGSSSGFRLTGMGYDGRWNSTDQVPDRAVAEGRIDRFGAIDPTDGGRSHRYSLSGDWQRFTERSFSEATAYVVDYRLDLFSNFTYFLEDSVRGDQFEQADQRVFYGLRASHTWKAHWQGREVSNSVGIQARRDDIGNVGLYHTQAQTRFSTVRADEVEQTSVSPYVENAVQWSPWLRSTAGLRADAYWFHVNSSNPLNSGASDASIVSPKLGVSLGPWANTAYFLNAGTGFHSNDARGATITVDPATLDPAARVSPLVRAKGAELGVVSRALLGAEMSLSIWWLDLASELVFTGDAGTTEASRPSRRTGAELTFVRSFGRALRLDADLAYSRARFTDADPAGDRIPGAVEGVVSAGATVPEWRAWFGSLRVRHFGPRPLIEDNSVRSKASTTLSAEAGRSIAHLGRLSVEVFNLLDARVSDVDYYYASRLPGESAEGVNDIHTHPQAPRTFRIRLTASWPRPGGELPPQTGHPRVGDDHH
jgi:hypothetical protein